MSVPKDICPICQRLRALRNDGTFRSHMVSADHPDDNLNRIWGRRSCKGSGQKPTGGSFQDRAFLTEVALSDAIAIAKKTRDLARELEKKAERAIVLLESYAKESDEKGR